MSKKSIFLIVLGILMIIAGIMLNPSFVGKLTSDGKINTLRGFEIIFITEFYLITFGIAIVLESLIIKIIPEGKRKYITIFFAGLVVIVTGIILSPSFVFEKIKFYGDTAGDNFYNLLFLRLIIITLGCLIIFSPFLFYRKRFSNKSNLVFLIGVPFLFLILSYSFYINKRYPSNIILNPSQLSKISDYVLGRNIMLTDFDPHVMLKVNNRDIVKAKYPVIDIHFHMSSDFKTAEDKKVISPEVLIKSMDSLGIKMIVDCDGRTIDELNEYHKKYPDRFLNFQNILLGSPWPLSNQFLGSLPAKLEKNVKEGWNGLGELSKALGLNMKDSSGKLIPIDDPRMDPLWDKAGELKVPVLWHASDPVQFYQPVDRHNEDYVELSKYPFWSYYGPEFPTRETIDKQRENVIRKHPDVIFILAHLGWYTDDLSRLGELFDKYPNVYADLAATLAEIGRQPYTTRKFFIKYQDRILFGSDGGSLFGIDGWTVAKFYQAYFDFLETDDEYMKYPLQGAIDQGEWRIYGINLPDSVLKKIYYENAEKILFPNKDAKNFTESLK